MTASWASTVALTVVAYSAGGSGAVAVAVLARSVPGAVAGPALGALVDRWPRARGMAWAAAVCSAASVAAAAARGSLVVVVTAVGVVALATMAFRTARSAALPELVEGAGDLVAANVLSGAIESLGVFAGPALAGLLLALRGPWLTFSVAAALFALAALLLARRTAGPTVPEQTTAPVPASTRELLGVRAGRLLLLLVLAQVVVSGGLAVLYAGLAVDALGAGVGAVGVLTSAFGLGGAVGSLGLFALAGSRRLGLLTAVALLLWAVPLALVSAAPGLGAVVSLLAVVGLGNVLFDVTCVTLLQRVVPQHLLGRAFGGLETVVVLGLGVGAVLAPPLSQLLGPARALGALGAFLAVVAVGFLPFLRALDVRVPAPARQVRLLRGLPAFALMAPLQLERLALRLQPRQAAAGDVVVRQGDPGEHYFVVGEGSLAVSVDGREVALLGRGEAFGEVALLHHRPRTATVAARTASELWSLEGPLFLAALRVDGSRALAAADTVAVRHLERARPCEDPATPRVAKDVGSGGPAPEGAP